MHARLLLIHPSSTLYPKQNASSLDDPGVVWEPADVRPAPGSISQTHVTLSGAVHASDSGLRTSNLLPIPILNT